MDICKYSPLFRKRLVSGVVGVSAVVFLSASLGAAAQTRGWVERRTANGCLFWTTIHKGFIDGRDANGSTTTYRWSGACKPGQHITGDGTLEVPQGANGHQHLTGRMVGGYWNGRVTSRLTYPVSVQGADQWEYNMGCMIRSHIPGRGWGNVRDDCVPGIATGVNAAAPASPRAPAAPVTPPPPAQQQISERTKALLARAQRGDAEAQSEIGLQFLYGVGLPKDRAEALKWLRLSAAKGNADALSGLAEMHERGEGVAKDPAEALRLYEAAVLSNPNHHLSLAALRRIEAQQRSEEVKRWQAEDAAPPRSTAVPRSVDAPVLGPNRIWVDPTTGAPCITQTAQHHEDGRFWRTYHLVLSNRCNLAFRIRADVDRWGDSPLYREQHRVIHRRRPGADLTEIRLTCMEARRPSRSFEIGCRGFSGWSVVGVAEGW